MNDDEARDAAQHTAGVASATVRPKELRSRVSAVKSSKSQRNCATQLNSVRRRSRRAADSYGATNPNAEAADHEKHEKHERHEKLRSGAPDELGLAHSQKVPPARGSTGKMRRERAVPQFTPAFL